MEKVIIPEKEEVDVDELARRLFKVSMKTPEHLKKWLEASGRRWLVLDTLELVDALPWPNGVDSLIQIIACYRDHRRVIPSGRVERQRDPTLKKEVDVPIMKDETLEVFELDRAIRYLIGQITTKDAKWKLENPPM